MKLTTICLSTVSIAAVLMSCASDAPKSAKAAPSDAQAMPPEVKPGPEHARLAQDAGVWDATVTNYMAPQPQVSKGVSTRHMTAGGLWLVEDFVGEMDAVHFVGHGLSGFDQEKKKYVGIWVDSMNSAPMISEGTYDATTKRSTSKSMMPMGAQTVPVTMVMEATSPDTQTFTMSMADADGKMQTAMKIEYARKR
jgi:hypothetical protein